MRRPLKPFVTEYKGTRRQASSPQPPSLQPSNTQSSSQATPEAAARPGDLRAFETERSRPRPVDFTARDEGDDTYEAAMRAADALFARPAPQQANASVALAAATEAPDTAASPAAPDRGGRILRALDEPPSPQLVALEAAHAPKRRGRKPGSKNKPKIKPVEIAPSEIAPPDGPTGMFGGGRRPARTRRSPGGRLEDPAPLAAEATTDAALAVRRLEAVPVAQAPSNGPPSPGSKRFSWVRDRLKPGEGWKRRRLPRVCW